ncbi:hypothetical protein [Halorubrum sp. PV6]|uniref:hypothetical protein n=1 Tax=Halorubrum sp. PV6 TaxID=634157 RepID=UPI000F855F3E|nr:hypothetical protein [Halorubrum sp. PV6]AZQ14553.1 hypothetical protein DOS48_06765 [Halorubrum sp. PV6]
MSPADRRRDDDTTGRPASADWRGTVAFALALLVASVIPVSWVAGDGAAGGSGAGALEIGLTDPFHLVGYAVLTVLASRALGRRRRGLLLAAAASVTLGFGVELVQAPIPWRSFAWRDAAVNGVGAVGVVGLVRARSAVRALTRGKKDDETE